MQYSWVNSTLKDNYGERGFVISSMMTLGFTMQIWVPLFTYPTVQAPRFPNGYPASAAFEFGMYAILMFGSWYIVRWKKRQGLGEEVSDVETARDSADDSEAGGEGSLSEKRNGKAVTAPRSSVYDGQETSSEVAGIRKHDQ